MVSPPAGPPGARRTRWWPVTAAVLLSACVVANLQVLDAAGDLSGLPLAERRVEALRAEVRKREQAALRPAEVEREIAQLAAQHAELSTFFETTPDEAVRALRDDLCSLGVRDVVIHRRWIHGPGDGRPWSRVLVDVRARPGGLDAHGLIAALMDQFALVSVRSLVVDDISDPESPFMLELETYAHAP